MNEPYDGLYDAVNKHLPMFSTPNGATVAVFSSAFIHKVEQAGDFVTRVTRWYEAALEQMEYCPFCGEVDPTVVLHGDRCPMALIVEQDTVFVE